MMTPPASVRLSLMGVSVASVVGLGALMLCASGVWLAQPAVACNEQVCASVVSKCMLTASCKCDLQNCSCCKECFNCLSYLYTECCSCVDMCPKPNATRNGLSSKSHVEDLEGIPGLFSALTEVDDADEGWSTMTFPVDFDAALYGAKFDWDLAVVSHGTGEQKLDTTPMNSKKVATTGTGSALGSSTAASSNAHVHHQHNGKIVTYNCTVVFMSQCLSWNKCKNNCQSMGASSYRWFHDGCCECVGSTCLNYGVNESRCKGCPDTHGADDGGGGGVPALAHEDDLDYGHVNGPMDGSDMHI